jgi:hypothetical protein
MCPVSGQLLTLIKGFLLNDGGTDHDIPQGIGLYLLSEFTWKFGREGQDIGWLVFASIVAI